MRAINGIKPQDILLLLKMLFWQNKPGWRHVDMAQELGLSSFEISIGLERCRRSRFLDASKKRVMKSALMEFLVHGLKYVFPAQPGHVCRGIPTAHSAPPLAGKIVADKQDQYVWPDDDGNLRGQAIEPIYESAPQAAKKDPAMHEMLALIDAIRVGRAREQALASKELSKRFGLSA